MAVIKDPDIPLSVFQDRVSYDPETGIFVWKNNKNARMIGKVAGYSMPKGYRVINFQNRDVLAHRLAWFLVYGKWPSAFIDHIDGNPANNSIANLREATNAENARNRRSPKGFFWNTQHQKFMAKIKVNYHDIYLGLFETETEAREAYLQAKRKYHGEFAPNYVKSVS